MVHTAYQPVLLFKSSGWKKRIRKLVYSTKEWRRSTAHDTSVENKKLFMEKKPYLFSHFPEVSSAGKKAHNGSRLATNCLNVICVRDREKWIMWHRSTKRISLDYYFDNFIALEGRQPYFVCAKREVVVSILSLRYLVRIDFLCDFPTPVMWLYLWYRSLHFDTTREFSLGFYGPNLGD